MMVAKHNTGHLVVLAAGGTGGHVFPAESLAQELLAQGHRLVLITDRRGAAYGGTLGLIETIRINAGPLAGRSLVSRVRALIDLARGFFEARRVLTELRPSVVVGFGGYAAAPTMLAAINLGLPTIVHEQNAVLGRTNKLVAARVKRVCISLELARPVADAAIIRTGMPVRSAIAAVRAVPYAAPSGNSSFRIVVLGGSQGAHIFSDVVPAAVALLPASLRKRLEIAQQCRAEDIDRAMAAYANLGVHVELRHFFDNVPELLANAHLLISRAGASTVAEASVAGRPALLIPYPHAADDHQSANAAAVATSGGGWIMPQTEFTPAALAGRLTQFAEVPELLSDAAAAATAFSIPDAASRLASVVTALIRGENGARNGNGNHVTAALQSTVKPGAA
ncbi:MAG: undecaprenyldiphospho-muramoylpentapeptide beta-N-acetylglucosaminyltransferase [Rhodospirillaceae bacterium]|nr:MAG: undecaprenyldiphospho-muramoylpentapeptide beta-N-acetylglucosaminyltransferase [Rhodospirillaceae bacterium]